MASDCVSNYRFGFLKPNRMEFGSEIYEENCQYNYIAYNLKGNRNLFL